MMTKHQLRLLLCAVSTLVLTAYSLFALDWFRIVVEGHAVGTVHFYIDLRGARQCLPSGACSGVPLSKFHGWYPTVSAVTFYGSAGLGLITAVQAGCRLFRGSASESVAKLSYLAAVICFCSAVMVGFLFPPEAAHDSVGFLSIASFSVSGTWAPAILMAANALAFVTHYFSVADELAVGTAQGVTASDEDGRKPAPLPLQMAGGQAPASFRPKTDTNSAASSLTGSERVASDSSARSADRASNVSTPPLVNTAPAASVIAAPSPLSATAAVIGVRPKLPPTVPPTVAAAPVETPDDFHFVVEDEEKIPAIESAIAELAIEPLRSPSRHSPPTEPLSLPALEMPQTTWPTLPPLEVDGFLTVKSDPSFALLRGKLRFATTEVALSTRGIDATCEDGITKVVLWHDVVGVVARRLPPVRPYSGETFVDVVSTSGSTLRILPWTHLTGEEVTNIGSDIIERARALVQIVASRCPDASVDHATRSFLGGRGQAAQLPSAELLAQHDERLS